jgi:outer membrane protein assembly factor BamB
VYALDLETGQEAGRFDLPGRVWSDPVIHEKVLYIHCGDGFLYALE